MRKSRVIIATVLAAGLSTSAGVCAQPASAPSSPGRLTLTISGEARGKPDAMYVEIFSEATDETILDAFQQCKEKADAAVKAVESLGIPDSQVARGMYEFSPATVVNPNAPPPGIRVLQSLRVKIKINEKAESDKIAETISPVLDAGRKAGVTFRSTSRFVNYPGDSAQVVSYVLQDATPLAKQAIADAFRKAEETKAALIASGITPGKFVSVDYQQPYR